MMRIVAGDFKGRKLKTPKGQATRPSPARLREALFDVLGDRVHDCVFYDFFAGSGAVGLEALSRGAPRAVFVEAARSALFCLDENIALLGCGDRAECVMRRLPAWLESPDFTPRLPAIFFLDPPFHQNLADAVLKVLSGIIPAPLQGKTAIESICAVQTEKGATLAERYGPWRLQKRYPHGDSALWIFEWAAQEISE